MSWKQVVPEADLPEGERRAVEVDDRSIPLIHHEDEIYAAEHACPHLKLPRERGKITEDGVIVCQWHHSACDLESGDVTQWSPWPTGLGRVWGTLSSEKTQPTFPTRREDGHIWVKVPK